MTYVMYSSHITRKLSLSGSQRMSSYSLFTRMEAFKRVFTVTGRLFGNSGICPKVFNIFFSPVSKNGIALYIQLWSLTTSLFLWIYFPFYIFLRCFPMAMSLAVARRGDCIYFECYLTINIWLSNNCLHTGFIEATEVPMT